MGYARDVQVFMYRYAYAANSGYGPTRVKGVNQPTNGGHLPWGVLILGNVKTWGNDHTRNQAQKKIRIFF